MRATFLLSAPTNFATVGARGAALLALAGLACAPLPLQAQAARTGGSLNVICSMAVEWCTAVKNEYEKTAGVTVNMTQKSTGEALAQIAAEKANPKLDLWIGGTGDP